MAHRVSTRDRCRGDHRHDPRAASADDAPQRRPRTLRRGPSEDRVGGGPRGSSPAGARLALLLFANAAATTTGCDRCCSGAAALVGSSASPGESSGDRRGVLAVGARPIHPCRFSEIRFSLLNADVGHNARDWGLPSASFPATDRASLMAVARVVDLIGHCGCSEMQLRLGDVLVASALALVERPGFRWASWRLVPWRGTRETRTWCRLWLSEVPLRGLSHRLEAPAR